MTEKEMIEKAVHIEMPKAKEIIEEYDRRREYSNGDSSLDRKMILNNKRLLHSRGILVMSIIILVCITGCTAYAFSPTLRTLFANKLHINEEDTSVIDKSMSDSGITMSVESSHVTGSTAVVMLAFAKESKEDFGNSLNPQIVNFVCGNVKVENYMVCTELSDDKKTLYCYYTWNDNELLDGKKVSLTVDRLVCNESQVEGKTFSDELLEGKWSLEFTLSANPDNSIKVVNKNLSKTISMCGKELQINSVTVSDLQIIAQTTTLSDKGKPEDVLSSISTDSGMYYGVYVCVLYEDGSQSENFDCRLDDNNNIIAYSWEPILKKKIKEIHVKDLVMPLE